VSWERDRLKILLEFMNKCTFIPIEYTLLPDFCEIWY